MNDSSGDALGNDSFHQQWNNSGSNSVVIECSSKSNTWQPNVHPFAHRTQQRYTNRKKQQQNNNNVSGVVVQVNNTNNAMPAAPAVPNIDNEESLEDSFEKIIRSADHRLVFQREINRTFMMLVPKKQNVFKSVQIYWINCSFCASLLEILLNIQ